MSTEVPPAKNLPPAAPAHAVAPAPPPHGEHFRARVAWLIAVLAAYETWAQFTLGIDLWASLVVTAITAATSFTAKAAMLAWKKGFRKAAGEAAEILFDTRTLGALTVLLAIGALLLTSIVVVNDTSAKGTLTVASMALPREHYIAYLGDSKGARFRSIVFAPFRKLEVSSAGRRCDPVRVYPIVFSEVFLSSCAPKPAVLVRIPLGAQMHLANGKLEIDAGDCHPRIDTAPHVAGVWVGAEKPSAEQWRQKWNTSLSAADVTAADAEAVIKLWMSSPLHPCTLGSTFSISGSFKAQGRIPIAKLEPTSIRFAEEPVDLEMAVKQ